MRAGRQASFERARLLVPFDYRRTQGLQADLTQAQGSRPRSGRSRPILVGTLRDPATPYRWECLRVMV